MLKFGLRPPQSQTLKNFAELSFSLCNDQRLAAAAGAFVPMRKCCAHAPFSARTQGFLNRKSFACQYCFVNKQFARFDQLAVALNLRPADSNATSPGTISATGTRTSAPSRSTRTFVSTTARNFSTAFAAPYSCQKPSTPLTNTIAKMNAASLASWRKIDRIAAPIRMRTIGLLN